MAAETKTYRPARQPAEALRMMERPDDWPQWPLLPLKRWTADSYSKMETGYLVDCAERCTVFLGNIFMARPNEDPQIKYPTLRAVVEAGWEVD